MRGSFAEPVVAHPGAGDNADRVERCDGEEKVVT